MGTQEISVWMTGGFSEGWPKFFCERGKSRRITEKPWQKNRKFVEICLRNKNGT
jgi:hypothetical protein